MKDFNVSLFRPIAILVSSTICCCILSTSTLAGELGKAKLSEKSIQVLGGRLTVRMPERARIEARPHDIMSAPETEEHETRVVFDAGQERLAFMVHETFAFVGEDFEKDVRGWVSKWKGKYRKEVGPDFLVHRLIVLERLGADSGHIGIYVGNHPDFEPGAKKGEGMMFGKKVAWHSFEQGGGMQALCELPVPGESHLSAHVWVQAPRVNQLQALKQAAESMKLVEPKKATN
jgi:hypothetical protein